MQQLKPLAELLQPDPTNTMFGKMDAETGSIGPVALGDIYGIVSQISTAENVPEDVRSYFESIKTLAVFGWFHYPLYTHVVFLASTAFGNGIARTLSCDRWGQPDDEAIDRSGSKSGTGAG